MKLKALNRILEAMAVLAGVFLVVQYLSNSAGSHTPHVITRGPSGVHLHATTTNILSAKEAPRDGDIKTANTYRLVIATIPRSGNGWIRGLIEAATGIGTESVFPEGNSVYHNVTEAYGTRAHVMLANMHPWGWLLLHWSRYACK